MYLLFLRKWKILSSSSLPPVSSNQPLDRTVGLHLLSIILCLSLLSLSIWMFHMWTCTCLISLFGSFYTSSPPRFLFNSYTTLHSLSSSSLFLFSFFLHHPKVFPFIFYSHSFSFVFPTLLTSGEGTALLYCSVASFFFIVTRSSPLSLFLSFAFCLLVFNLSFFFLSFSLFLSFSIRGF